MVNIVNLVATGDLGRECDLRALSEDLDLPSLKYEPETFPGLQIRLESEGAFMALFFSGTYTITGVTSESEMENFVSKVINEIEALGLKIEDINPPEIKNLVCKGDLKREFDLSALTLALGVERTEYEPEQSPFVYYWPEEVDCLITIPSNGEVIITGVQTRSDAEDAFNYLREKIQSLYPGRPDSSNSTN